MRDSVVRGIDRVDPFKDFHHGLLEGERLHIRPLDQLTSETLAVNELFNSPFFSPDGASVGF